MNSMSSNLSPIEQSVIDLLRKVRYGEVVIKVENKVITDVFEKHQHKPFDLVDKMNKNL